MPAHQRLCLHEKPCRQENASFLWSTKDPPAERISWLHAGKWWRIGKRIAQARYCRIKQLKINLKRSKIREIHLYGYSKCDKLRRPLRQHSARKDKTHPTERNCHREGHIFQSLGCAARRWYRSHFKPPLRQDAEACAADEDNNRSKC